MIKYTLKIAGLAVATILIVGLMLSLAGTLLWLLYPVLHEVFPSAIKNNTLAAELEWFTSVKVAWLCAVLFKTTTNIKKD